MLRSWIGRFGLVLLAGGLPQVHAQAAGAVDLWLTTADRSALFTEQQPLAFHKAAAQEAAITVDDTIRYQGIDGFGFALTGGSAELLMRMSPAHRTALLKELFSTQGTSIGVSYLRVSIGSSDMNERVFTYDDLAPGSQDPTLTHFNLGPDLADVVPVLKEILAIDPHLSILGSPWSAPAWMKTNGKSKAGSLLPADYGVYAQYFVKYIQAMAAQGIPISAVTVQNEPLNTNNTPSMLMNARDEADFIANALGPALRGARIKTGIILYDHNCDKPEYPLSILADAKARQYVLGSGFHLYGGAITAMTEVHDAYPNKNLYFTEQMVVQPPPETPFKIEEPVSRIVIGATRNWGRNVVLWNLAADPNDGPHTSDGGCPVCQGAVTLDGDTVTRNLAFYTIAHVSKFVRPGSVRIHSTIPAGAELEDAAFETPDHKKILLVTNTTQAPHSFSVRFRGKEFTSTLDAGAVGTYVWR